MLYKLLLLLLLPVSSQAMEMALAIGLQAYKVVQTARTIEQIFATEGDQLLERFLLPNAFSFAMSAVSFATTKATDCLTSCLTKSAQLSTSKEVIQNQLMLNHLKIDDPKVSIPYKNALQKLHSLMYDENAMFKGITTLEEQRQASWVVADFICQVYDKNTRDLVAIPLSQNNISFQIRGPQAKSLGANFSNAVIKNQYNKCLGASLICSKNNDFTAITSLVHNHLRQAQNSKDLDQQIQLIEESGIFFKLANIKNQATLDGVLYKHMLDPYTYTTQNIHMATNKNRRYFNRLLDARYDLTQAMLSDSGIPRDHHMGKILAYELLGCVKNPSKAGKYLDYLTTSNNPEACTISQQLRINVLESPRYSSFWHNFEHPVEVGSKGYYSEFIIQRAYLAEKAPHFFDYMQLAEGKNNYVLNALLNGQPALTLNPLTQDNSLIPQSYYSEQLQECFCQLQEIEQSLDIQANAYMREQKLQEILLQPEYVELRKMIAQEPFFYIHDTYQKLLIEWPETPNAVLKLYEEAQKIPTFKQVLQAFKYQDLDAYQKIRSLAFSYQFNYEDKVLNLNGRKNPHPNWGPERWKNNAKDYYLEKTVIDGFLEENQLGLDQYEKMQYLTTGQLPVWCQAYGSAQNPTLTEQEGAEVDQFITNLKRLPRHTALGSDSQYIVEQCSYPGQSFSFNTSHAPPGASYPTNNQLSTYSACAEKRACITHLANNDKVLQQCFDELQAIEAIVEEKLDAQIKIQGGGPFRGDVEAFKNQVRYSLLLRPEYRPLRAKILSKPYFYVFDNYQECMIEWPEAKSAVQTLYSNAEHFSKKELRSMQNQGVNAYQKISFLDASYKLQDRILALAKDKTLYKDWSRARWLQATEAYTINKVKIEQFIDANPCNLNAIEKARYLATGELPKECVVSKDVELLLTQYDVDKFEFCKKLPQQASFATHQAIIETLAKTSDLVKASQRSVGITKTFAQSIVSSAQQANMLNREGKIEAANNLTIFLHRALDCAQRFVYGSVKPFSDLAKRETWKSLFEFSVFANRYIAERYIANRCQEFAGQLRVFENIVSLAFNIPEEFKAVSIFLQEQSDLINTKHSHINKAVINSLIESLQKTTIEDLAEFAGGFVSPVAYCSGVLRCLKIAGLAHKQLELAHIVSTMVGRLNKPEAVAMILGEAGMASQEISFFTEVATNVAKETVINTGQAEKVAKALAQGISANTKSEKLYLLLSADTAKRTEKFNNALLKSRKQAVQAYAKQLIGNQVNPKLEKTVQQGLGKYADSLARPKCAIHNVPMEKQLHIATFEELDGLITSAKDWEKLAKPFDRTVKIPTTDIAIYNDFEHIFNPVAKIECNTGKITFSGFHHDKNGLLEKSGLLEIIDRVDHANGFYQYKWRLKGSNADFKPSSFFPQHWSQAEVVENIHKGLKNTTSNVFDGNRYRLVGKIDNNLALQMIIDKTGELVSAFPKF